MPGARRLPGELPEDFNEIKELINTYKKDEDLYENELEELDFEIASELGRKGHFVLPSRYTLVLTQWDPDEIGITAINHLLSVKRSYRFDREEIDAVAIDQLEGLALAVRGVRIAIGDVEISQ